VQRFRGGLVFKAHRLLHDCRAVPGVRERVLVDQVLLAHDPLLYTVSHERGTPAPVFLMGEVPLYQVSENASWSTKYYSRMILCSRHAYSSQFKTHRNVQRFTEMCSGSEAGSYLRLIDFCMTVVRCQMSENASWSTKYYSRMILYCIQFLMSEVPLHLCFLWARYSSTRCLRTRPGRPSTTRV